MYYLCICLFMADQVCAVPKQQREVHAGGLVRVREVERLGGVVAVGHKDHGAVPPIIN